MGKTSNLFTAITNILYGGSQKTPLAPTQVPRRQVYVKPNYEMDYVLHDGEGQPIDNSKLEPHEPPRGGVLVRKE